MTAHSRSLVATSAERARRHRDWPGVRTFRSPAFRLVVATSVWLLATGLLGALLLRQAADPAGQYAFDFQTYHAAAAEVAAGRSPYAAEMFDGPIPAQGAGVSLYKYPPPFAQALVPLAALPLAVAAALWLAAQAAMLLGGVWLALRAGGARRSVETLAWSAVAVTLFLPAFDTLWKGNVSGLLALFVGIALAGGASGGLALAGATLLKTTPVVLVAPMLARGPVRRGMLAGLAIVAVSVAVSTAAWIDFVRVLPNLIAGPAHYPTNLAPDSLAALLMPSVPLLAELLRLVAIAGGVAAVLGAVVLARQRDGWPAAVMLGVIALLLLPSATWYHYLAVLLPVAAFAWPRAGIGARTTMLAGAGAISAALLWLPLAVAGAGAVLAGALHAVWPRTADGAHWGGLGARLGAAAAARLRAGADRAWALVGTPAVRRRLALYLSLFGYGLGIMVAFLLIRQDGGFAYDAHAYWLAGQNVLAGQPLYWPHDEGTLGAFRYPPLFAQLWAPFTLLPGLVFSWLWRIVCFLSLRYLAGSWRNVGLWLLVPLVWIELSIANVTFPVAALCLMALRGQASGVAWAGALKFGPLLLMPYLWLRRPEARRSLLVGGAALAAAIAVSFALAPDAWVTYVQALGWMGASSTDSYGVIGLFGNGVLDAALNVAIGVLLVVAALYRGSDRLAYAATVIAVPVLAWWRLTPLLALPRLGRARR